MSDPNEKITLTFTRRQLEMIADGLDILSPAPEEYAGDGVQEVLDQTSAMIRAHLKAK